MIANKFSSFWFAPADPHPLAIFRIFTGTLLFFLYLAIAPHWQNFYGPSGFKFEAPGWVDLFGWFSFLPLEFFWAAGLVASVCFVIGYQTKLSTVVLFLIHAAMIQTNRMAVNGEDLVFRVLLFYSIFACLNGTLSVDSWLRKKNNRPTLTGAMWPVRLIQINTALIYFFSLPLKLQADGSWLSGDFMYYALVNSTWSRFPFPEMASYWVVSASMTYVALAMEGLIPFLVWIKKLRLYIVMAAVFFHISIGIILNNVTFFSFSMVCAFMVFLKESDLKKIFQITNK